MRSDFFKANFAQTLVNVLYGSGAVVSSIGIVHEVHPIYFSFLRSAMCLGLFTCLAVLERVRSRAYVPSKPEFRELLSTDRWLFLGMACTLFSGNMFNMMGLASAGAVTTSLWQPSQPVITLLAAILLKTERLTVMRSIGISLATGGCFIMVATSLSPSTDDLTGKNGVAGNFFLLLNVLSTPLCIIASKGLLHKGYSRLLLSTAGFFVATILSALSEPDPPSAPSHPFPPSPDWPCRVREPIVPRPHSSHSLPTTGYIRARCDAPRYVQWGRSRMRVGPISSVPRTPCSCVGRCCLHFCGT